jgi:hypothetical protein
MKRVHFDREISLYDRAILLSIEHQADRDRAQVQCAGPEQRPALVELLRARAVHDAEREFAFGFEWALPATENERRVEQFNRKQKTRAVTDQQALALYRNAERDAARWRRRWICTFYALSAALGALTSILWQAWR